MTSSEAWISEPGIYDIPADVYHRDCVKGGSLSASGAKKLMPPSCPALFKQWRDGGSEHREVFDIGRAAHRLVLGAGDPIVVVEADDWRTAAAKAQRAAAYEAGHTPVLTKQYDEIQTMADRLREHPIAAALLHPDSGKAEQTIVWRDQETGVWCRALVDWLRHQQDGQRHLVVDYKTASDVDPDSIQKALNNFAYYMQGAWYCEGSDELGLGEGDAAFLLIVQMKTAPYLVTVAQVHPDSLMWGHRRNRKARDLYRHCMERDEWPGYADDHVISTALSHYATNQLEAALLMGDFELEGAVL